MEEAGTVLVEGDEYLECPLPLDPHLQELLGVEELSPANAIVGDGLSPPPMSMPKDPEPSPLCYVEWIEWCIKHVPMSHWWEELVEIPGHEDYQQFARKVHASFEVLKACNWAKGVDHDHILPPSHHWIGKYWFLLPRDEWFGTQDYWLTQSQHMIAYTRVLQYWAKKAQLPFPDQPCHLAGSMVELQWVMEQPVSFAEEDILWPLHHPIGWRWVHPGWWVPSCEMPTTVAAVAKAARST